MNYFIVWRIRVAVKERVVASIFITQNIFDGANHR